MTPGRHSTVPRPRRLARTAALVAALAASCAVAACTGSAPPPAASPIPPPTPTAGPAILGTRGQLEAVLHGAGFGLIDFRKPYLPPETSRLATAPRGVYQVVLAGDPDHGVLVVYDLGDANSAAAAGREFATYLASGPIRVNFTPDTRFALQQVGSTLVFFTWSGSSSPDGDAGRAGAVIARLGTPIPVE